MCGIVGYVGPNDGLNVVMDGLRRLEYRGYDSAGVAVFNGDMIQCVKSPGKLQNLDAKLERQPIAGNLAIGHTRWATHGVPNEANAHPHTDNAGRIAVVHNGIIENFQALRERMEAEGAEFKSDTDTETLAHLVRHYYDGDLFAAVKRTLQDVTGAYALAVISTGHPGLIVAARSGPPLIVGVGDGEAFVASDVPAIMKQTRRRHVPRRRPHRRRCARMPVRHRRQRTVRRRQLDVHTVETGRRCRGERRLTPISC